MACVCTAVPLIVYTYYIYFTTDLGSQAFDLPFAMWYVDSSKYTKIIKILNSSKWFAIHRFPFNWKNPVGFLVAISIQYTITAYGLTFCACVFGLAVGCFLYVIALNKIIKASLFNFSQNTRAKIDQIILLEQLIEFIELHSGAKQLSRINNFFEPQLACESWSVSIYYFQIGQQFFGCVPRHYCARFWEQSDRY